MVGLRETLSIIIDADGTKATKTFSGVSSSLKKEFGDLEQKSGGFVDKLVSKSPLATSALDKIGLSGAQAGGLLEAAIPAGMAVAGAAVAGFAIKSIANFQNLAQQVLHFKEIAGATAEDSSRWVEVADDYGVSVDTLSGSMGKLSKTIGTTPDKLEALGVSIAHNKDGSVDLSATLVNVIAAYNGTNDATKRAAIAQQAFGRGWQGLVKILDAGSTEVQAAFKAVSEHQVLHDDDLHNSEKLRKAWENLKDAGQQVGNMIGRALLGPIANFVQLAGTAANKTVEWYDKLDKLNTKILNLPGGLGDIAKQAEDTLNPLSALSDAAGALDEAFSGKKVGTSEGFNAAAKKAMQDTAEQQAAAEESMQAMSAAGKKALDEINKSVEESDKIWAKHIQTVLDVANEYGGFNTAALLTKGLTDDALAEMSKSAQGFRDSFYNAFHNATGPLDEFKNATTVSAAEFEKSLTDQASKAEEWQTKLKTAADQGINVGFLQTIAEAGPKSLPILDGLLKATADKGVEWVNNTLQATDNAVGTAENALINHIPEWTAGADGLGQGAVSGLTSGLAAVPGVAGTASAAGAAMLAASDDPWRAGAAGNGDAAVSGLTGALGPMGPQAATSSAAAAGMLAATDDPWRTGAAGLGDKANEGLGTTIVKISATATSAGNAGASSLLNTAGQWEASGRTIAERTRQAVQDVLSKPFSMGGIVGPQGPSSSGTDGKATGGVLSPGKLTLVGEKGPELIVPGIQPKTVVPNSVLRAGLGGAQIDARLIVQGNVYGVDDLDSWANERDRRLRLRALAGVR